MHMDVGVIPPFQFSSYRALTSRLIKILIYVTIDKTQKAIEYK